MKIWWLNLIKNPFPKRYCGSLGLRICLITNAALNYRIYKRDFRSFFKANYSKEKFRRYHTKYFTRQPKPGYWMTNFKPFLNLYLRGFNAPTSICKKFSTMRFVFFTLRSSVSAGWFKCAAEQQKRKKYEQISTFCRQYLDIFLSVFTVHPYDPRYRRSSSFPLPLFNSVSFCESSNIKHSANIQLPDRTVKIIPWLPQTVNIFTESLGSLMSVNYLEWLLRE